MMKVPGMFISYALTYGIHLFQLNLENVFHETYFPQFSLQFKILPINYITLFIYLSCQIVLFIEFLY